MAAAEKMVGIALSNTTPLMPPTGGAEKKLGNELALKVGMGTLE